MKDHLVIDDFRDYQYRIVWFLEEEQEYGAYVGEGSIRLAEPDRAKEPDEWEVWTAYRIAWEDENHNQDEIGFYWESKSKAQRVLAKIKAAFKAKRPLADWEKKALDAGWTPPKGWS